MSLSAITVEPIRPADREDVTHFLVTFPRGPTLSVEQWAEHLRQRWDENPAFSPDWPQGWVIRKDGHVKGFFGSIPRWLWVDGELRRSANATTWYVLPECGAQALKQLLAFSHAPAAAYFNTTAIEKIWRLLEANRFQKFPEVSTASVLVVDPGPLAAQRMRGPLARLSPLALALGRVVRPALRLPLLISRLTGGGTRGVEATTVTSADQRFDELWARVRPSSGITADRSAASLNWYLRTNRRLERVLIAATQDTRLAGYALFAQQANPSFVRWDCVDVILESPSPWILRALVEGAWAECRRRGVAMALLPHWTESLEMLYRSLSLPRRAITSEGRYLKLGPGVAGPLQLPSDFYGDYGL